MERFLLDEIPVSVTLDEMLAALRIEDEEDTRLVSGLFAAAKEIARPKALYKAASVDGIAGKLHVTVDGTRFTGAVLARNMREVHRVFAYVCTCGVEVDAWSRAEKDPIVSLWLDIIKERFLGDAIAFLHNHIKDKYGIVTLSAINPGSGSADAWPITQQKPLHSLIGRVTEDAGVTLTDSCLMLPTKSTSGLLYASSTEFFNCLLCERKNCPRRKAEYHPA